MSTIDTLRELLLPVFGLENADEIPLEASLVNDMGADSLDFVEIFYIIESNFSVTLTNKEVFLDGQIFKSDELFVEGVMTQEKVDQVLARLPGAATRIFAGMTRAQLFMGITVSDLAQAIDAKKATTC